MNFKWAKRLTAVNIWLILIATICIIIVGCKDATQAQFKALGSRHKITMYGCDGRIIGQWESTGNVSNEAQTDGWYFEDVKTHKLVELTGALVIEQE